MTTYVEFRTALGDLSITGVVRQYGYGEGPPASLNAGELPASWAQEPSGDLHAVVFGGGPSVTEFHALLIVAVLPTAHSTLADADKATAVMMDNVRAAVSASNLARSHTSGKVRQAVVTVAKVDYWAVVAELQATG